MVVVGGKFQISEVIFALFFVQEHISSYIAPVAHSSIKIFQINYTSVLVK